MGRDSDCLRRPICASRIKSTPGFVSVPHGFAAQSFVAPHTNSKRHLTVAPHFIHGCTSGVLCHKLTAIIVRMSAPSPKGACRFGGVVKVTFQERCRSHTGAAGPHWSPMPRRSLSTARRASCQCFRPDPLRRSPSRASQVKLHPRRQAVSIHKNLSPICASSENENGCHLQAKSKSETLVASSGYKISGRSVCGDWSRFYYGSLPHVTIAL